MSEVACWMAEHIEFSYRDMYTLVDIHSIFIYTFRLEKKNKKKPTTRSFLVAIAGIASCKSKAFVLLRVLHLVQSSGKRWIDGHSTHSSLLILTRFMLITTAIITIFRFFLVAQ